MADDFAAMGVSFFAGGYVTTCPSVLPCSRRSPWLGGEDITGAIVKAAHARSIKAIAMADLSVLPPFVVEDHPEWASVDERGAAFRGPGGMYTACIMMFGGASYGFHGKICHCPGCRNGYEAGYQDMVQILANGASPMVNLSGGHPAVHEDKRGFRAPTELFHLLRDHAEYYDGDRSRANVALVYYGRSDKEARYLEGFRGYERALRENQLPFDIISTKVVDEAHLARYRVLVLPTLACMSDAAAGFPHRRSPPRAVRRIDPARERR